MYITACSTISYQPTFRNKGFSQQVSELKPSAELITPDYSEYIPAMDRRRMSDVLKMSIACAKDCLEQCGLRQPDAIVVGTSMGCSIHTRNFLDKIFSANGGPLSPTSFIVSLHNTIAGQISLLIGNHGYNMTHTQNSLSFEQGLIDAMLCIGEGCSNVLVGGADEKENTIYNMKERLKNENIHISAGASFFILSDENTNSSRVKLVDVGSFGLITDPVRIVTGFLSSNNLTPEKIDLVLYSTSDEVITDDLKILFRQKQIVDFQKITGTYFTNSAFALNYGIDILLSQMNRVFGEGINKVLICNNLIPENVGLILLENKCD